eukprot:12418049-Karenia_brevis.AAC.1
MQLGPLVLVDVISPHCSRQLIMPALSPVAMMVHSKWGILEASQDRELRWIFPMRFSSLDATGFHP